MPSDRFGEFSGKALGASLLFVLLNAAFFAFFFWNQPSAAYRQVLPNLLFQQGQEVRAGFLSSGDQNADSSLPLAEAGQRLAVGMVIQTGEGALAELELQGNALLIEENSQLRLLESRVEAAYGYDPQTPRLVMDLNRGSVLVKAFDRIQIQTPSSQVAFEYSAGRVSYSEGQNQVMVFSGAAEVALLNQEGEFNGEEERLAALSVPLLTQVAYADSQISSQYASLKPSKLRKELKLSSAPQEWLSDPWVQQALAMNLSEALLAEEGIRLYSQGSYQLRKMLLDLRSVFTLAPEARRELEKEKIDLLLGFLLANGSEEGVLTELSALLERRGNDPYIQGSLTAAFLMSSALPSQASAFAAQEEILSQLLHFRGSRMLRDYLLRIQEQMERGQLAEAEGLTKAWLAHWQSGNLKEEAGEFADQSEILRQLILAYSGLASRNLLSAFDETGRQRLEAEGEPEEVRFSVTQDRLSVAAALIGAYRYPEAKRYLRDSYNSLGIDFLPADLGSTEIFLEFGRLLAQRLEYAEDQLKSRPEPIDEQAFAKYLQDRRREALLSDDLREFLEIDTPSNPLQADIQMPSPDQMVSQLAAVGIQVSLSSILPSGNPAEFSIQNALVKRSGQSISFSAVFNASSASFSQVESQGKSINGTFALNDLAQALFLRQSAAQGQEMADVGGALEDLKDLLSNQENQQLAQQQVFARELAKQVAFNRLAQYGIRLTSVRSLEVLDLTELDEFEVKEAFVDISDGTVARLSFEYDQSIERARKVTLLPEGAELSTEISIDQLLEELEAYVNRQKAVQQALEKVEKYAQDNQLSFDPQSFSLDPSESLALFTVTLDTLDLTAEAVFDLEGERFASLSHPLHSAQDVSAQEYFTELVRSHAEDFLSQNGLPVSADIEWNLAYPFKEVSVKGYPAPNQTFSFTLDFENNRLLSVSSSSGGSKIEQMSFEDFKKVLQAGGGPKVPGT